MILLRQTALLFGLWLTVIALWMAVIGDTPAPVFAARIDHAITLYRAGRIKKILFTGGRSSEDELSESAAARDYALKAEVPSEAILFEQKSRTTHQNLIEAQTVMVRNDLTSALLVSDPLHLRRAQIMAWDLGIDARPSATPSTRYQTWSTQGPFLVREVFYIHVFWLFGQ